MDFKNMGKSKKIIVAEIIGIVFLSLIFGVGMGNILVGNLNLLDEGQFAAWPFQMLAGKQMFSDLFIMYGPLYVYPLYVIFKIFEPSFFAIRVIFWLESLLGILAVYFLCVNLNFKRLTGLLIVLFLILLPAMQIRQASALITILLLYVAHKKKSKWWAFIAGILTVVSFLISPEVGIFLSIAIFADFVADFRGWIKNGRLKWFLFGFLSTASMFGMWANAEGWLRVYVSETFFVLSSFSGANAPLGKSFPNLFVIFPREVSHVNILKFIFSPEALMYLGILFLIVGFIYFAARIILRKFTRQDKQILPLYILSLFSYLTVVGRASVNNIYFVLPFALIVGGYLVELLIAEFKPWNKNLYQKVIPMIVIAVIIMIPIRLVTINKINIANKLKMIGNYNSYQPISGNDPLRVSPEQKKYFDSVRSIIKKETNPGDPIFILQDEPGLYVVANRVNATRFDLPYFANTYQLRMQVLNDLEQKKPKIIIWNPKAWAVDEIPNDIRLPEVVRYIENHYNKTLLQGFVVYKLNEKN